MILRLARYVPAVFLDLDLTKWDKVCYPSKDGTQVPMFIVRHNSTPFDDTAPAIQYGYGGFSISIESFFSPMFFTFTQIYGGVIAVPNIRGGNELSEDWYLGGAFKNKKNCFDAFIAATDYLVKNKYWAQEKLRSTVVPTVGTFGVAVAGVGVLDMLKFHKFTIWKAWTSDDGNPDDPHDFDFIYPISSSSTTSLILLRVDKKAGHSAGKPVEKRIQEAADKRGFVNQSMGVVCGKTSRTACRLFLILLLPIFCLPCYMIPENRNEIPDPLMIEIVTLL